MTSLPTALLSHYFLRDRQFSQTFSYPFFGFEFDTVRYLLRLRTFAEFSRCIDEVVLSIKALQYGGSGSVSA